MELAMRLVPNINPAQMSDDDWHVFAQDIANIWADPEERAIAYQAASEAIKPLRAVLERWDRNENRNCLNWGPCSRHDERMADYPPTT